MVAGRYPHRLRQRARQGSRSHEQSRHLRDRRQGGRHGGAAHDVRRAGRGQAGVEPRRQDDRVRSGRRTAVLRLQPLQARGHPRGRRYAARSHRIARSRGQLPAVDQGWQVDPRDRRRRSRAVSGACALLGRSRRAAHYGPPRRQFTVARTGWRHCDRRVNEQRTLRSVCGRGRKVAQAHIAERVECRRRVREGGRRDVHRARRRDGQRPAVASRPARRRDRNSR